MVAETGVVWPPAKECLEPPEVGKEKEPIVPLTLWREHVSTDIFLVDFWL